MQGISGTKGRLSFYGLVVGSNEAYNNKRDVADTAQATRSSESYI